MAALSWSDAAGPLVCLGECMVEFRRDGPELWRQGFAGDSLNVAWALAALTSRGVDYATLIGSDPLSDEMASFIAGGGIGTRRIGRLPDRGVGLYTIATDAAGERSFTYWRGESAARLLARQAGDIARRLDGAGLVYLSGISAAILGAEGRAHLLADLAALRAEGLRIVYDPNYRPRLWGDVAEMRLFTRRMAALCDVILPTFEDEAAGFGDADPAGTIARLSGWSGAELVVKDGRRATMVLAQGRLMTLPPARPRQPLDTTGAGDSFNGAFLAARLAGAPAEEAVRRAQAVAAEVVMRPGALIPQDALRAAFDSGG